MRCYNGCPDDELQAMLDHRSELKRRARDMDACIVYFPAEGKWGAGDLLRGHKPIGQLCHTIDAAFALIVEHRMKESKR